MARARGKGNLQIGLPMQAIEDLEVLAPMVGKSIAQRGVTANQVAAWLIQHGLTLESKQLLKAIHAGITREGKYLGTNPGVQAVEGDGPSGAIGSVTKGTTHTLPGCIDGRGKQRSQHHTVGSKIG